MEGYNIGAAVLKVLTLRVLFNEDMELVFELLTCLHKICSLVINIPVHENLYIL